MDIKIISLVIGMILAFIIIFITLFVGPTAPVPIINSDNEIQKSPEQSDNNDVNDNQETTSASQSSPDNSAGGSSGDSSQDSSGQGSPFCTTSPVSHSAKNFQVSSNCTSYEGETCTEKEVSCYLKVTNLDQEIAGDFGIEFKITNNSNSIIDSVSLTNYILPAESSDFFNLFEIQGENADSDLTCSYLITEVPLKEIC